MTDSTGERVECPICGQGFDPTAAGGWCTNSECGEWQYLGDEVPEPAEPGSADGSSSGDAVDPADDADMDGEWIDPSTEESAAEAVSDEEVKAAAGAAEAAETDSAGAAETESAGVDAGPESATDSSDDELTLEFGRTPADESAEDEESVADGDVAETDRELSEDDTGETAACPDCGADVAPADAFCAACGADLDAAGAPETAAQDDDFERLALTARGQEVLVSPDQTVGREIRRIVTETGGDEDDAVLIHREHVRFVREDGRFYVVDLGDNPTKLNGSRLSKGDREPVEPGDELALSDVVTLSVERP